MLESTSSQEVGHRMLESTSSHEVGYRTLESTSSHEVGEGEQEREREKNKKMLKQLGHSPSLEVSTHHTHNLLSLIHHK